MGGAELKQLKKQLNVTAVTQLRLRFRIARNEAISTPLSFGMNKIEPDIEHHFRYNEKRGRKLISVYNLKLN